MSKEYGAGEITQRIKALAFDPEDLSSSHHTHEEKNELSYLSSCTGI